MSADRPLASQLSVEPLVRPTREKVRTLHAWAVLIEEAKVRRPRGVPREQE